MENTDIERLQKTTDLESLYPVLEDLRMTPGWHKKRPSLWKEPKTEFIPLHWRYEVAKYALDQAGKWIGTDLAERRNFLLFNPVGDNEYDSVRTLVVAYQMIKPGEHARAHWHTPNAMRLILDAGPGCYTVVDGTKLPMKTGDFLLTPSGCWHSHYNEGDRNAYWIDFLDVPLVHLLEPMFAQEHPDKFQPVIAEPSEHPFYFPLHSSIEQVAALPYEGGIKRLSLGIENHIKTSAAETIMMTGQSALDLGRNTASHIFAVVKGKGSITIESQRFAWSSGDVLVVPSWKRHSISSQEDSILLRVTDEPTLQKLGFYRVE